MRIETVTFVARFVMPVVVLLLGFSSASVAQIDFNASASPALGETGSAFQYSTSGAVSSCSK